MARIRTIKPEFADSESMARVSRDARLLFVLLWTIADDDGRMRGMPRHLAGKLLSYDADAPDLIEGWLGELEREGCVQLYTNAGSHYLQICRWAEHQRIDKPSPSRLPAPDVEGSAAVSANVREESQNVREELRPRARADLDLGPPTNDQGKGIGPGAERAVDATDMPADAGPVSAPSKPVATRAAPKMSHDPALYAEVKAEVWEWLGLGDRPSPGTAKNADTLIKVYLAAGETGRSVRADAALWPREWPGTEGRPPSAKHAQDFRSRLRTGYRPGERRNGNGAARATAPPDVADDWGWGTEPIPADPTPQEAAL